MPFFKSTYNILKKCDEDEVFESRWFDSDTLQLPPKIDWDYKRELQIEDVDIWEVLYEASEGVGVYAAWMPYAEFYLITTGINYNNDPRIYKFNENGLPSTPYWDRYTETYYGAKAQQRVYQRCKELKIPLSTHQIWIENEDMWLYQNQLVNKPI